MVANQRDPELIRPLTQAEALCLNCPLPECDETDPRCPYQRATGARIRRRERMRLYMRRWRAAARAARKGPG